MSNAKTTKEYQAGFKDGFCKAMDLIIDHARFNQTTYKSIYRLFIDDKEDLKK